MAMLVFGRVGDGVGWLFGLILHSLKLTASLHLKMDVRKTTFLLGRPIFRGYVSFRECI